MDTKAESSSGQQEVIIVRSDLQALIFMLCDEAVYRGAWFKHYERAIRRADPDGGRKGYDSFVEHTDVAKQIARRMGMELDDYQHNDWRPVMPETGRALYENFVEPPQDTEGEDE